MPSIIKPYGSSPSKGWEWDGKVLKPYGRSPVEGWEWDGKVFKPFGRSSVEGWELEGDAGIYILAMVSDLLANYSQPVNVKVKENKKSPSNLKRNSKSKSLSPAEELGERFADYLVGLLEKLIAKIINHFKS